MMIIERNSISLTRIKKIRYHFAKGLFNQMFTLYPFIVFARSKEVLPLEISKDFNSLNISGSIFKIVLPGELEALIKGPMFLLGTNSFKSYETYIKTCPNSVILLRWSIEGKAYITTTFDFEKALKLGALNTNIQDTNYYFN